MTPRERLADRRRTEGIQRLGEPRRMVWVIGGRVAKGWGSRHLTAAGRRFRARIRLHRLWSEK